MMYQENWSTFDAF